jgi:DNA-binding HxlR family transcriptional regulator
MAARSGQCIKMKSRSSISVPAIAESLLKRKWTLLVLRHLKSGRKDPSEIIKVDPSISTKVLNDRLRTLLRYELITRCSKSAPSSAIEYRLTVLGEKMVDMMNIIEQLDREYHDARFTNNRSDGYPETYNELEPMTG